MAEEKFIWCRNCNEVHHVTVYDKAPLYLSSQEKDDGVAVDDWRVFMSQHRGHRLEALCSGDPALWEGGGLDPVRERYIEVTNGHEWFVVRGSRARVDESLNFTLTPGRLRTTLAAIEIQENEIRLEMKRHFFWGESRPNDNKIESFIALLRDRVSALRHEEICVSRYDSADSTVGYAGLDDGFVENLLRKCEPLFLPEEFIHLKGFVYGQRKGDGVMALRVKHQYGLDQPVPLVFDSNLK